MENEKETFDGDTEEDLKKVFPSLYKEITSNEESLQEEDEYTTQGVKKIRKFSGYNPGLVDFICRCKSIAEALDIIEYLRNRNEIDIEEYEEAKKQLLEEGLESFGPHREPGYYERA